MAVADILRCHGSIASPLSMKCGHDGFFQAKICLISSLSTSNFFFTALVDSLWAREVSLVKEEEEIRKAASP